MNTKDEKPDEKDPIGGEEEPEEEVFSDSVELFSSLFREESQALAAKSEGEEPDAETAPSDKVAGSPGTPGKKDATAPKIPIPTPQPPSQQQPPEKKAPEAKKAPARAPARAPAPGKGAGSPGTPGKKGATAPKIPIPTPQPPPQKQPPVATKPGAQKQAPPPGTPPKQPPAATKPGGQKQAPPLGTPQKPDTPPVPPSPAVPEKEPVEIAKPEPSVGEKTLKEGKGKKSGTILKLVLLLAVLGILAVFGLNYFGIVDLMGKKGTSKEAERAKIRAQVQKKLKKTPPKTAKKTPKSTAKKAPAPKQKAPVAPKPAEKAAQKGATPVEKPKTTPPAEKAAPAVSVAKVQKPPVPPAPEPKAKAPAPALSAYPYAVYLGSYKTGKGVKKAMSAYQETGVSSYWIRVDLGEKGLWYRLFTGYFPNRNAADAFIREKKISEGKTRNTKYANLIGVFRTQEELKGLQLRVEEAGQSPYIIEGPDGQLMLYTGAFYQKSRAEEQNKRLLAKGIESRVVER